MQPSGNYFLTPESSVIVSIWFCLKNSTLIMYRMIVIILISRFNYSIWLNVHKTLLFLNSLIVICFSCTRYDTLTNQWSCMAPMTVARSNSGTTVSSNRIYCMGGHDSIHYLNSVEKFNPKTNRWHCVHSMQVKRFGMGAATLYVPLYE